MVELIKKDGQWCYDEPGYPMYLGDENLMSKSCEDSIDYDPECNLTEEEEEEIMAEYLVKIEQQEITAFWNSFENHI